MHRFVAPAMIAAALHGLIFGWPRSPFMPPHHPTVASPSDDDTPRIDLAALTPPDDSDDSGGGDPAAQLIARLPDVPTADTASAFHVAVQADPIRPITPGIDRISGIKIGWSAGAGLGGPGSAIAALAALDHAPRVRVQIPPEYPPAARHAGLTGEVVVEFVVDESGRVTNARVARSTDPEFDDAALRAVSAWRFEPGTVHNRLVRFRMAVPLEFHLEN